MLIIAFLLTLLEFGLFLFPKLVGENMVGRFLYSPQVITQEEYAHYLAVRDPILGWPSPALRGHKHIDASGARFSPAFPVPSKECVTLYGDSFTFGDEVTDEQAWGNILAQHLGCRVGNFGVGGYGTDQAFLRFLHNRNDPSSLTLLGIYSDNLLRNVNQYRGFLAPASTLGLKPRFVLDGATLRLVSLPNLSYSEFIAGFRDPLAVWKDEWFQPGSADGPIIWSFPYVISLARLLSSPFVRDYLRHQPSWIEFYHPSHPSHALPITIAIAEAFSEVAAGREKSFVVVLFPVRYGYDMFRHTGTSPYETLTVALQKRGIAVIDLTKTLAAQLQGETLCKLLTQPTACGGHFNAEGNELIAATVHGYIVHGELVRLPD